MAIGNPITLTSNVASKTISVIATAGQTLFTVTGGYRINQLAVFRNGVRLLDSRDYEARNGSTVTLLSAATVGDALEFQVFDDFRVADAIVSAESEQTISGNLTVSGGMTVAGLLTATDISLTDVSLRHLEATGISTVSDTTQATSTTTGALVVSGGVGIAKSLFVGGNVSVGGTLSYEDVTNIDSVGIITAQSHVSIADSILHTGDTDTSIRFPAAGTFTVETNGSEALRVHSGGPFSVGTASTNDAFVNINPPSTHADQTVLRLRNDGNNNTRLKFSNKTAGLGEIAYNGDFRFVDSENSDAERLRVTDDGRVGINETSPDTLLHVKGADNVLATFESTDADSLIEFKDNGTSDTILMGALGGDDLLFRCDAGNIVFHTNNNNETVRVSAGGSFGIGTNNPDRMLSVSDTTNGKLARFIGPTNNLFIMNDRSGIIDLNSSGSGDHLCLGTQNTERLRISSNGSVGINTTLTSGALTVNIAGDYKTSTQNVADEGLIFQSFTTASTGDVYPGISWTGNPTALGRARASITAIATNDNAGSDLVFLTRNQADGTELDVTDDEKLRITSAGRIGIGTDSPQAYLVVQGDSNDSTLPSIRLQDGTDARQVQITNSSGDFLVKTCGSDNNTHGSIKIFESGIIALSNGGASGSNVERLRIDTVGTFHFKNGAMVENGIVDTTARNGTQAVNLDNGMVHYFQSSSTGTWKPNFRVNSTNTLNSAMGTGDVVSPTMIVNKSNTAHYADTIQVDGTDVTPDWLGGAPTEGGGNNTWDIYSYTIIKTGDAAFKCWASVSNYD